MAEIDLVEEIAYLYAYVWNWEQLSNSRKDAFRIKARRLIANFGYVKLAKDQTPPFDWLEKLEPRYNGDANHAIHRVTPELVAAFVKAGWRKVEL